MFSRLPKLPSFLFLNFENLNCACPPKLILAKFLKFGHLQQKLYHLKILILLIRESKCLRRNEENEVSVNTLIIKKIKYSFFNTPRGKRNYSTVFPKLKLNNRNMDYIMRSDNIRMESIQMKSLRLKSMRMKSIRMKSI